MGVAAPEEAGKPMNHSHLVSRLDHPRILAAISAAEADTTGQIRVMVSKRSYRDALSAAEKHFKVLKLGKSPHRNAVLIFVAPKSQTFAIYGDAATHARCGPAFWDVLRDEVAGHLKGARFTDAVVHAIAKTGEQLAIHFPRDVSAS